jgi:hypothetical protein
MKTYCIFLATGFISLSSLLSAQLSDQMILQRIDEPVEKAFFILKPKGWLEEGGITRWDPIRMGGAANAIEAKIDFKLKSDPAGTIQIHWLPDIYFADMTGSMVAGMFQEGSFYNGMPVLRKMDAPTFLQHHLFPYLHPDIKVKTTETRLLPEIEKLCYETDVAKQLQSKYSSAVADFFYTENGVKYKERAFCIIQDMGPYTAGMWKNRSTVVIRAPEAFFDSWEPLFHEIGASVELNPQWIAGELRGQMQRGSTMIKTMQDVNRIGQEIQKGHAETNAKINHQAYLNLTDQEDYINPHTQKLERATNQWNHRWVDDLGNVIYTNNTEYNPNFDLELQMQGFIRSPVKKQIP